MTVHTVAKLCLPKHFKCAFYKAKPEYTELHPVIFIYSQVSWFSWIHITSMSQHHCNLAQPYAVTWHYEMSPPLSSVSHSNADMINLASRPLVATCLSAWERGGHLVQQSAWASHSFMCPLTAQTCKLIKLMDWAFKCF